MATITQPVEELAPAEPAGAVEPTPTAVRRFRRFRVDEFQKILDAGVFGEDERLELLEGWIVTKMVHNPPHDNAIELIDEAIRPRLVAGWRLRIQ